MGIEDDAVLVLVHDVSKKSGGPWPVVLLKGVVT
jgi:hypothetical protein